VPLDMDKYRPHFKEYALTDEQEKSLIEALYAVAETFADLTFGLHSSRHIDAANDNVSARGSDVVQLFKQSARKRTDDAGHADELQSLLGQARRRSWA
jgi:hypothetical protein